MDPPDTRRPRLTLIEFGLGLGSLAVGCCAGPLPGLLALAGSVLVGATLRVVVRRRRFHREVAYFDALRAAVDPDRDPLLARSLGGYTLWRRLEEERWYWGLPEGSSAEAAGVAVHVVPDEEGSGPWEAALGPWLKASHPLLEGLVASGAQHGFLWAAFRCEPGRPLREFFPLAPCDLEARLGPVSSVLTHLVSAGPPGDLAERLSVTPGGLRLRFAYEREWGPQECILPSELPRALLAWGSPTRTLLAAWGLLLCEAVSGSHPLADPPRALERLCAGEPLLVEAEPAELREYILMLLARDPQGGFESLEAAQERFEEILRSLSGR